MKKIAVIGLGIMGRGMATNILNAGYSLTVWNRTRGKTAEFAEMGARVADTPKEAAAGADVIITMLSDPPAVEFVAFGKDGVMEGLEKGSVLIDCSTVDQSTSHRLASAAKEKGADFLDSPVGGSRDAAESGSLVLMVGGDAAVLERVRPLLMKMGNKIVHAGGVGAGATLKLCFNLVIAHSAAALAETLMLGTRAGLDPSLVLDAVNSSIAGSRLYEWKGNCILDRDFSTNFALKLIHKDLNLMMSTGYATNTPLPVTAAVKELFSEAKACTDPELDYCSVIRALEMLTGTVVKK
jgi:3-hydroxyisobutyrate dehydrogenase-like beta-hydroxyacid dehydrogenase